MRILRTGAFWMLVLGLAVQVGCKSAEEKAADEADMKKLEGTWTFTSRVAAAEADEDADDVPVDEKPDLGSAYVIEKDKLTYRFNGTPYRWQRVTVDAKKGTIDLLELKEDGSRVTTSSRKTSGTGKKKKTTTTTTEYKQLGVYKIDGETLTLTLSPVNGKTRPSEVNAKGKGFYTLVLKKSKDGKEEKPAEKTEEEKKKEKEEADKKKKEEEGKQNNKEEKKPEDKNKSDVGDK